MKLNLGSGPDYRDGSEWINLDAYLDSSHHEGETQPPDVLADAHHLPFVEPSARQHSASESKTIEHIRASHVIEHLEVPLDALRECYRVLEPGGTIYVEVPDPWRTPHERDDHLYSFSKDTLRNIVRRAGFDVELYRKHERDWGNWTGKAHSIQAQKPNMTGIE